jgi:hypothetical protein
MYPQSLLLNGGIAKIVAVSPRYTGHRTGKVYRVIKLARNGQEIGSLNIFGSNLIEAEKRGLLKPKKVIYFKASFGAGSVQPFISQIRGLTKMDIYHAKPFLSKYGKIPSGDPLNYKNQLWELEEEQAG